jgi:hypothetical protein
MDRPERNGEGEPARLAIFRLVPTASRNDRRHARDAFHGEVVVRARSPEDARQVASEAESEGRRGGDSLFNDADCYTVIEVPGVDFLRSGKRGLIAGRLAKPVAG